MDPSHRDLAIRAADGGGDAVLLEALLEEVDISNSGTASPQALSPRVAWPEQDHEDLSFVEPLVSACREMEALEDQALATLWSDYERAARARLEAWHESRDASAQRWAQVKHSLRGEWQDKALLSAGSSDAEDREELPSSPSAAGLVAADDHAVVTEEEEEEEGAPQEEPVSVGGVLDGTQKWEALRDRMDEVLRMAAEKGQTLETEEADLDVDEGGVAASRTPQGPSDCHNDSSSTGEKADTSQTISREDPPMTVVDVVRPALPSQGTEAPVPKEVPQSAWASSLARRRELSRMVQEDALVAAQASATQHERGRLTLEDKFALRYRQWELYQQGRSPPRLLLITLACSALEAQQRELSYERRAMEGADQAARAWLQRQHAERLLMTIADDQSAAHRMEDRREVEGRRMLRAMHESRAYRIHLKALQRNRDAMVLEDCMGWERRESLRMAEEERPSSWWRHADRAVTVIARTLRKRRAEVAADGAPRIQTAYRGFRQQKHFLAVISSAVRIQAAFRGHRQRRRYSSIRNGVHHDPAAAAELGEVDLTDILRAEEGISSLFPDRPTLVLPNQTEEAVDGPAGWTPNEAHIRQPDTAKEGEENIHPA
ncbi:hypothetical protein FOZ63_023815, partial [Perkinsus olseni]